MIKSIKTQDINVKCEPMGNFILGGLLVQAFLWNLMILKVEKILKF